MEAHKPHKERILYFCTPCKRGFTTLASLKYHYNIKHREDYEQLGFTMKRFTCSECSCEILGERRYLMHMERHKQKHNLANHIKMHKKSSPTRTVLDIEPISVEHVNEENNISEENINASSSDTKQELTSNEASNKNSISIVDIEEDNNKNDSGDKNLNGIEETVNFTTGKSTQHKGTVLNVEPISEEHVNEENNVSEENINASSSDIKQELTKKVRMKMYHCSMCDYKTIQICNLKRHKQVHLSWDERYPFVCTHCGKKFATTIKLKQHILQHHHFFIHSSANTALNSEPISVEHVNEENINASSSDIKQELFTTDTVVNTESVILDNLKQENHSEENINVSSSDINLKLNTSNKASNKKSISIVDITEENDNSDENVNVIAKIIKLGNNSHVVYKCNKCGFQSMRKNLLLKHVQKHLPLEKRKRHQCPTCGGMYSNLNSFKFHMRVRHNQVSTGDKYNPPIFKCTQCHIMKPSKKLLLIHMESHKPPEERNRHQCSVCYSTFTAFASLKYHMNIKHREYCEQIGFAMKRFTCSKCSREIVGERRYHTHMERHRQNSKESRTQEVQKVMHNCSMCDFKTIHKCNLTRHKRVHLALEERQLFACGHCDKKYTVKASLKQHLMQHRNIHDVERTSSEGNNQEEQVQNSVEQKLELDTRASDLSSIENNEQEKTLIIKEELDGVLRFKRTTMQKIMFKCHLCDYITTDMSNFGRHKAFHLVPQKHQLFAYAQCNQTLMTRKALQTNHLGNNHTNSSLTVDTVDLTTEDNEQELQVQNGIEQKLELDIHDVELTSSEGNIQEEQVQNCIEPKLELDIHYDELTIAGDYKQEEYFQTNILSDDKLELDINTVDLTSTETNEQEEHVSNSVEQKLELVVVLNRVDADGVVNNTVDLTSTETNEQEEQVSNSVEQKLELVVVLNRLDSDGVVNNTVDLTSTETNEQEEQVSNNVEQKLELVVVLNRLDCDGIVNSDIQAIKLTSTVDHKQENHVQKREASDSEEFDIQAIELTSTVDNKQENHVQKREASDSEEFDIQAIELTSTVDNKQENHVQKREASDSEEFDIQAIELTSTVDNKQENHVQKREASDSEELTIEVDKRVYDCTVCGYQTTIKKNLERHQQVHLSREERQLVSCPLCDKKYTTKSSLNYHLVGNHHAFTEGGTIELTRAEGNAQEEHVQNSVTSHDKLKPRTMELNQRIYKCNMCDYRTLRNRFLKNHQQVHLPREERQLFPCPLCNKKYMTNQKLNSHLVGNHPDFTEGRTVEHTGAEGNEQEEHVQYSVISDDELEPEGRTVEHTGAEGNEQEEHVQYSVISDDELEPRTMELNKRVYKCTMCDYQTIKNKYLKSHQQVHLPREERRWYTCPICDRKYARNIHLRHHLVKNHPDFIRTNEVEKRVYKCTMCDYKPKKNKYLKSHQQVHLPREERRWFTCPICDKKYTTKVSLNYHLVGNHPDFTEGRTVEHTGAEDNEQEEHVQNSVTSDGELETEDRTVEHTGAEGSEQEEHVQNSVTSDDELEPEGRTVELTGAEGNEQEEHIQNSVTSHDKLEPRTMELNKRVYKCTMCDYQTIKNKYLKSHQQVHLPREERRWYTCPICDRKYARNVHLRHHLVKNHPDFIRTNEVEKRVYKCTMCDYQTIKNKYLKSHQQVHLPREERRWFTCPICDRKYTTKISLNYHLVGNHRDFTEGRTVEHTGAEDNEQEEHVQNSVTSDGELETEDRTVEHTGAEGSEQEEHVQNSVTSDDELETEGRTVELTGAEGNEQEERVQNSVTSHDKLEPTMELNKRVYKCTMCDYKPKKNKYLKSHQQVHLSREERRWYTCPICDRKYTRNTSLRHHLVKNHPDFTESRTVDLTGADDKEREKHFQNSITSDKIIDESISIMNEENAESFIKMEIDDGAPTLDEGMHYDFENADLSETNIAKPGDLIEIEIDDKAPLLDFNNWDLVDQPEQVKIEDIVTLLQPESS
ncbi:zinc finger protein 521-like isoform X4 [Sitophilus oryzae]|uniref:Zinc finger protein 521-like isoform X4 n=1 Tax=Sitophilus oryzae TaxID=7048 RepID=A0A6J2XYI5_SITOR|nr:zinc finger protein 521-like isoform X4 [Sitophilus oryzae]